MLNSIVLGAGMVEVDQSGKTLVFGKTNTDGDGGGSTLEQGWAAARGQLNEPRVEAEGGSEGCRIPVSPSRFQALAYISEEDEVEIDELSEAKEGEIVVDKNEQWCRKNLSDSVSLLQSLREDPKMLPMLLKLLRRRLPARKTSSLCRFAPNQKKTFVRQS